ncbi:MAG: hypothetical protein V2B19_21055 [Pseudomonadota bacterium]
MECKKAYSEIEEQLLKEGFVTPEDLAAARELRDKNMALAQKSLGLILAGKGQLSPEKLNELLTHPESQGKIGLAAVEMGLITQQQLTECRDIARDAARTLTSILVQKGYLATADRKKLLYQQLQDIGIAKLAIRNNLISERDLEDALKLKSYRKSACEILYDGNFITLSELNHVFRKFGLELKLGQILSQQELLTVEQVEEALGEQAAISQSLGEILLKKGWIAIEQLYFALSIQYNTPFQKLDGYVYYEKQKVVLRDIVGQQYASENQILPLFQVGNNLTLAVSNPAKIRGMEELKSRYPTLQMACVLITSEKFEQLYAILYGELLNARNGDSNRTPELAPDKTVIISDPTAQKSLIKKLYEDYRYYQQTMGASSIDEEESFFYAFIDESYQTVCEQFGCVEVLYRFEVKENHIHILASPVALSGA